MTVYECIKSLSPDEMVEYLIGGLETDLYYFMLGISECSPYEKDSLRMFLDCEVDHRHDWNLYRLIFGKYEPDNDSLPW